MKTLVVFYSRTGTTKRVAQKIASELKCDVEEIFDEKNRAGPIGWLGGGKDAAQNKLTQIKPIKFDPQKYDLVIVGSPIWAGKMAPALRTYLSQNKLTNIAAFCTMGGNDSKSFITDFNQCFGKTKAFLGIQTVIVKKGNINGQVEEFVKLLN